LNYKTTDKREWYRTVYLKSDHWKALRARKLVQCGSCEKCGSTNCLDVHHLRYKKLFNVELEDLLTLCRICHAEEHERLEALRPKEFRKKIPSKRIFKPGYSNKWAGHNKRWGQTNRAINMIRKEILKRAETGTGK
jgi:5-methylcytosine-specific restriction endonuclease McrA